MQGAKMNGLQTIKLLRLEKEAGIIKLYFSCNSTTNSSQQRTNRSRNPGVYTAGYTKENLVDLIMAIGITVTNLFNVTMYIDFPVAVAL
jgi:hypothetical protein